MLKLTGNNERKSTVEAFPALARSKVSFKMFNLKIIKNQNKWRDFLEIIEN